jgi:Asp-tRNA(Asn)/Glu-tRNA(Gln) amidotransferase A subunit family amidase
MRSLAGLVLAGGLALPGFSAGEAPPFEFVEATLDDIHSGVRAGDITCEEVVSGYLRRIEAYDQQTGLNAVIFTNPHALDEARRIDRKVAAGKPVGRLFCAPVLLKDNFDTEGMATSGGSIALKESVPPDDAFLVARLKAADAIIAAKTNMAEWAFSPRQTVSSSYGVTANAYDLERVPAGSSGGSASGVAASFGVIGMGSDTGNSIRGPSSHLALFGIRPTLGLTSRDGIIPLVFDRDVAGPMTRTVRDAARTLTVISGYDPADPYTEVVQSRPTEDYEAYLDAGALAGRRLGVLRALVDTDGADPEVTAVFEQALKDLSAAGATLIDPFQIDDLDAHLAADYFCPRFRYDAHRYLESLAPRAPIRDITELLETGEFSPYIEDRLKHFARFPVDRPPAEWDPPCPGFEAHEGRKRYRADTLASMDRVDVDAIVYPTWTNPPALLAKAVEDYRGDNSQLIAPATGLPAATVPMGYSHGDLPAGLQILGRPFSEGVLFAIAYAYEQATAHRRPPAGFPELPPQP